MQNISSIAGLNNAIKLLETEQNIQGQLLKEQVYLTYESLKPINLIKKTFNEILSVPNLDADIPVTAISIATGFLFKKLFIGASGSAFRRLIGSVLQFGVTNIFLRNSDLIRYLRQIIFRFIPPKKEKE